VARGFVTKFSVAAANLLEAFCANTTNSGALDQIPQREMAQEHPFPTPTPVAQADCLLSSNGCAIREPHITDYWLPQWTKTM
jgi:hypothetical protein